MKELYYWIMFFVLVVAVSVFFKYYYQPGIGVRVDFGQISPTTNNTYVYQTMTLPIIINNTGSSSIQEVAVGILVNGNISSVYKVSIPAEEHATINFTYTPKKNGTYTFAAVVDPSSLYNIKDRSEAQNTINIDVMAPKPAAPYMLLDANPTSYKFSNSSGYGLSIATYLSLNFSYNQFQSSNLSEVNSFVNPIFYVSTPYITSAYSAFGIYNNYSLVSLWLSGYLNPSIVKAAAQGRGLQTHNVSVNGGQIMFVNLTNTTSLCTWYNGGWLKMLAAQGKGCISEANPSGTSKLKTPVNVSATANFTPGNAIPLASYGTWRNGMESVTRLMLFNTSTAAYETISFGNEQNSTCFGAVSLVNGSYYCSLFLFPLSGKLGNLSLIKTTTFVGKYNLTVASLGPTSQTFGQFPINIKVIKNFGVNGNSTKFVAAFTNACAFIPSLTCSNANFSNSTLTFKLKDNYSSSVAINQVGCAFSGAVQMKNFKTALSVNGISNFSVPCFEDGNTITGLPLNLNLRMFLNYTVNGNTSTIAGVARII